MTETPDARECARKAHAQMEDLRAKAAVASAERAADINEQEPRPKWSDLFGIDPTYDEDRIEEPTFTASELKERLETATAVALALGRKEMLTEVLERLKADEGVNLGAVQRALRGHSLTAEHGSERLTAAPASPSTPEESVPAESAFPDLPEGSDQ